MLFPQSESWDEGRTFEELILIPWYFLYAIINISKPDQTQEACRLSLYIYIIKHIKSWIKSLYLKTLPFDGFDMSWKSLTPH